MKAIETKYQGYRFRSRLEARYAVYFDAIGLEWDYEVEGFHFKDDTFYLPDFWLPQVNMWAEVKAKELTGREFALICNLVKEGEKPCILLIGTPSAKPYDYVSTYKGEIVLGNPCNVAISMYHNYPREEKRFYSCVQEDEIFNGGFEDIINAVECARSARFEHGQTP